MEHNTGQLHHAQLNQLAQSTTVQTSPLLVPLSLSLASIAADGSSSLLMHHQRQPEQDHHHEPLYVSAADSLKARSDSPYAQIAQVAHTVRRSSLGFDGTTPQSRFSVEKALEESRGRASRDSILGSRLPLDPEYIVIDEATRTRALQQAATTSAYEPIKTAAADVKGFLVEGVHTAGAVAKPFGGFSESRQSSEDFNLERKVSASSGGSNRSHRSNSSSRYPALGPHRMPSYVPDMGREGSATSSGSGRSNHRHGDGAGAGAGTGAGAGAGVRMSRQRFVPDYSSMKTTKGVLAAQAQGSGDSSGVCPTYVSSTQAVEARGEQKVYEPVVFNRGSSTCSVVI